MKLETIPSTHLHKFLGAVPESNRRCRFTLWAPHHDQVTVELCDQKRVVPMQKHGGYHIANAAGIDVGEHYHYRLDGGPPRPDPASRFQRDGVHGPSEIVSSEFDWSDSGWTGVAKEDLVIYEVHTGAFTERGTFTAAIERLDELVELGITAVELMPVAESAGQWNWGYDGVCLFAPTNNFGCPDSLRQFVDAAHSKGLAVLLDVVYNHLGPEGNYWAELGPYLSDKHETLWGAAPNFDDPTDSGPLRRFYIANAIHWFDEYHIDGLRVDAIHCMQDDSDRHIVTEIAETVQQWAQQSGRPAMLIAETNVYDAEMLTAIEHGGTGFDALWCDDFLHSVFAVVRPGEQLSNRTYASGIDLDQTLRMGYVYEGTLRRDRVRHRLAPRVDTHGMIYSIQNHDFIGNHPLGKRFHQLTSVDTQKAAAALLILSPAIPMLFMGEEFACDQSFRFFVDFGDPSLRQAVIEGRRNEYPQHDWSGGMLPTDADAFHLSKIGTPENGNLDVRSWYRTLIGLRKQWRLQGLLSDDHLCVETDVDRGIFSLRYEVGNESVHVIVRLTADPTADDEYPITVSGRLLLDSHGRQSEPQVLLPNHAKVFSRRVPCASS